MQAIDTTATRYEVQLESNGTPKCGFAAGTWFQTHPFMDDFASQHDAEAAITSYRDAHGELWYLPMRVVMIQTTVAVVATPDA